MNPVMSLCELSVLTQTNEDYGRLAMITASELGHYVSSVEDALLALSSDCLENHGDESDVIASVNLHRDCI
jgi:hypothetical protein